MINTSTELDITTQSIEIDEYDYSPPIKLFLEENDDRIKYIPVSFERKLIKYDITISQAVYSDGSIGGSFFVIKIDSSKNIIKSRFEILDL